MCVPALRGALLRRESVISLLGTFPPLWRKEQEVDQTFDVFIIFIYLLTAKLATLEICKLHPPADIL